MVKVVCDVKGKTLPCEVYIDGYLHENLKLLFELVKNNWDGIDVTWGYEGDGKSVFTMQKSLVLDANFGLHNIVFTPEQFEESVEKAEKFTAIMWDEADILAGNWWDDTLQAIKRKLKRIRSKNLFISLVTPTIFDMDKYFVIHRTRYGIEVYSQGKQRGFFKFYSRERKKDLYLKGRRDWNTSLGKPNFIGRFTDLPSGFPINWKEYEDKKDEATSALIEAQGLSKQEYLVSYRRDCLRRLDEMLKLKYNRTWSQDEYGKVLGVNRSNISRDFKYM